MGVDRSLQGLLGALRRQNWLDKADGIVYLARRRTPIRNCLARFNIGEEAVLRNIQYQIFNAQYPTDARQLGH